MTREQIKQSVENIDNLEQLYRDMMLNAIADKHIDISIFDIYLHRAYHIGLQTGLDADADFKDCHSNPEELNELAYNDSSQELIPDEIDDNGNKIYRGTFNNCVFTMDGSRIMKKQLHG